MSQSPRVSALGTTSIERLKALIKTDCAELSDAERLRVAFTLHKAGRKLMLQNIRRDNPRLSDAEIDAMLRVWLARQGP